MKVKTSSSKVNSHTQGDHRALYLASLIKNISNALIFTDMEFNIREWNTAAENLYGWTEAEVIGRPLRDFIQSEYEHAAREDVVNIVLEKGNWKGEGTQNRKDGTRFPMTVSVSLVKDEADNLIGFVTIICDITDRKHVDEEIVSMAKFPSENPNPVLRLSRDGIVMYANTASAALLRSWGCTTGGSAPRFWRDLTTETLASMENKTVETECDGRVYSIFVAPIANAGYVNLYGRDATERKQMEETLKESEAKFRLVFEGSPLGKSLMDMDGMLMVNQAFCDILGYSEEELKAKSWKEITHPDDIQKSLDVVQSLVDGKVSNVHFEKRYIHKNGRPVWTDVISALHRNENGKPLYFITTLKDITERRQIEEVLARQAEDLRRSNDELQQFAYVASHDLQEPLRMVASYTKLLEKRYKGRLDEDADEFINYVVDGATRMQQLINSLLDYSRVGTHGEEFFATSCETILDEVLANLALAIEDSGAVITHDSLPTLMTDALQLTQLFQNLIANAIRFRGAQPLEIHISAERRQADWLFSVRDNGIGMESQYFERIFVIFQRLHTRAEYPGTGIGLAICKKIVERLGGRIWVDSEPGKGTTFRFTISIENT